MADRPEKCPFCSAPVVGDGPVCEQCGFDLTGDWRLNLNDNADGTFDPGMRGCVTCGVLNPLGFNSCFQCGSPLKNTVAQLDPNRHYAATMPSNRTAPGESLSKWLGRNAAGWAAIAMAVILVIMGANAQTLAMMAVVSVFPLVTGLLLLEVPFKFSRSFLKPSSCGPRSAKQEGAATPAATGRPGVMSHLLAIIGGIGIAIGMYAAGMFGGPEAVLLLFFVTWVALIVAKCAKVIFARGSGRQ